MLEGLEFLEALEPLEALDTLEALGTLEDLAHLDSLGDLETLGNLDTLDPPGIPASPGHSAQPPTRIAQFRKRDVKRMSNLCQLYVKADIRRRESATTCRKKKKTRSRRASSSKGNGRSRGIRTHDPVIKSHLLYQLSYAPIHIAFTIRMERAKGLEPSTTTLARWHSTN